MTSLRVRAHAKINLFLNVIGRRTDGYHEIRTVAQTVTLHDTLEFKIGGDRFHLEVDDPALPAGPANLITRAFERLAPPLAPGRGLRIRLSKRIPAGAGLGGGSSDAAATLVGLNALCRLGLEPAALLAHAAGLGSDVPYFLTGGTALLTGRGTKVEPLPDGPPADLLIVFPGKALATATVYAQLQEPLTLARQTASMSGLGGMPADVVSWVRFGNDLEPHAVGLCPEIGRIRAMLCAEGAQAAAMTGSGSAVFGVFDGAPLARAAAGAFSQRGFRTFLCRTLDRDSHQRSRLGA